MFVLDKIPSATFNLFLLMLCHVEQVIEILGIPVIPCKDEARGLTISMPGWAI